jgi:hypothetical protein
MLLPWEIFLFPVGSLVAYTGSLVPPVLPVAFLEAYTGVFLVAIIYCFNLLFLYNIIYINHSNKPL